jgi:glycosyltransferase involved in cell wall biosynthesis
MTKLTLCLVVKNEEAILEKCLQSIYQIADEIVIVDTGSTDKTIEIAQKYTKNLYHFPWIDDFAAAKNFALTKCSHDYICTWDADWVLREGDIYTLIDKKKQFKNYDRIYLNWNHEFDENLVVKRQAKYHFIFNKKLFHWESAIHSDLFPNDKHRSTHDVFYPEIEVYHFKDPILKAHRYAQTERLVLQELNKNPDNTRLRIFLAQGYQFKGEYDIAIENFQKALQDSTLDEQMYINVHERIGICYLKMKKPKPGIHFLNNCELAQHPKIILILADLHLMNNPIKSYKLYKQFIASKYTKEPTDFDYYPERYEVYPYIMLGKLSLMVFRKKQAKEYFKIALDRTSSIEQKEKLETLMSR